MSDLSDLIDANVVDMSGGDAIDAQVDVNELRWKDWNAFWPLASGSNPPGTTPDVSGHGYDATYGSGISFANQAMVMQGSGIVSIPPLSSVPAVDITRSYSVSAWVTMTNTSAFKTFVSADGNQVSAFYLQKRGDQDNCFSFTLPTADIDTAAVHPSVCAAMALSIVPKAGTLYHLVGTRDAASGLDTLYVNGVLAATANCPSSSGAGWAASTFGIGHGKYNGAIVDQLVGSISNVGLIGRVLTSDEVAALYQQGAY